MRFHFATYHSNFELHRVETGHQELSVTRNGLGAWHSDLSFVISFCQFPCTAQRMSILPRRIFFQPAIVHVFSAFPKCLSLRWHSPITRQEFGRHFEELVVQSLRKYSFDVAVCGGPKDRGIDFRGIWLLKTSSVPVIGQCRRYKKRLGPKHVRELVGTLTHEAKGTLGIIVTECG